MVSTEELQRIFECVLVQCKPGSLAGAFGFLAPDPDVYRCPERGALLTALSAEFAADALIESGVVCRAVDAALVIAPAFSDPNGMLVALRDSATGGVVEIMTEIGCATRRDLPVIAVLNDVFTCNAAMQNDGELLVVPSLADVALLRASGFAATLLTGLDNLDPRQVDRLCECFGLNRRKSNRLRDAELAEQSQQTEAAGGHEDESLDDLEDEVDGDDEANSDDEADSPPGETGLESVRSNSAGDESEKQIEWKLVFAGWSPSTLELAMPVSIASAATHLKCLDDLWGVETTEFFLWRPETAAFKRLAYFAQHGDGAGWREAMLDSIYDSTTDLLMTFAEKQTQPPVCPEDLPTALACLRDILLRGPGARLNANEQQLAWRNLERTLELDVIQPLVIDALSSSNSLERSLRLGVAQISRIFHLCAAGANLQLSQMVAARSEDCVNGAPQDEIDNLLKMADHLVRLSREAERCQHSTTIKSIPSKVVCRDNVHGLPNSD